MFHKIQVNSDRNKHGLQRTREFKQMVVRSREITETGHLRNYALGAWNSS